MKIKCMAEIPVAEQTVEDVIEALRRLPEGAVLSDVRFDTNLFQAWWEEDR